MAPTFVGSFDPAAPVVAEMVAQVFQDTPTAEKSLWDARGATPTEFARASDEIVFVLDEAWEPIAFAARHAQTVWSMRVAGLSPRAFLRFLRRELTRQFVLGRMPLYAVSPHARDRWLKALGGVPDQALDPLGFTTYRFDHVREPLQLRR